MAYNTETLKARAIKDIDVIKSFGERIKIGTTLTFDNDIDSLEWENGAATPLSRIDGLRKFSENGVKTWASFEPVIIPEQSLTMLKEVSSFISHVMVGKLNNYKGIDKGIDWAKFIFDVVRICRDSELPFYIKKDLALFNNGVYLSGNEINEDYLNL